MNIPVLNVGSWWLEFQLIGTDDERIVAGADRGWRRARARSRSTT